MYLLLILEREGRPGWIGEKGGKISFCFHQFSLIGSVTVWAMRVVKQEMFDGTTPSNFQILKVKDLGPGMKVARGKSVWRVSANLGWLLFHQPMLGKNARWQHIIVFRRFEKGDEVSFIWAFDSSEIEVDVLE